MKKTILLFLALLSPLAALSLRADDFVVRDIASQVKNFPLDSINLSSPLDYYLSRARVMVTGKESMWAAISTSRYSFDSNAPDREVDDGLRSRVLDENIDFIITYRDSVAAVVTHSEGDDFVLLNYCWIEDGRWVNGGQGMADNLTEAHEASKRQLPVHHRNLPRIAAINAIPDDITPFTDFLGGVTSSPEQFLLDMLASHRLVINGELHRRKVSWDMLKRLIALPGFADKVGHVFLELPSWCQPEMDRFMAAATPESDIVLQIFREEQPNGWWDRGEYEFICDLWALNHKLPHDRKIKVVLADYQIPYSLTTSAEQHEEEDRNTHMADVIERTLSATGDTRGALFLVGCAHAYKSAQEGIASAAHGKDSQKTAGAQLADRLGADNVFTVFQHMMSGDNSGRNRQPLRGGVFDRAFALAGNRPTGFRLAGSPFGKEPFDGIYEIKYNASTGSYADNYDGYLFLHPTENEPSATPLTEVFTDEFVEEMKRRASAMDMEDMRWIWFGTTASNLTKEYIIERLRQ